MLQLAMPDRRSPHHQPAVRDRLRYAPELFGCLEQRGGANRRARFPERNIVWLYYPQAAETEIRHRPRRCSYIERIARRDHHDPKIAFPIFGDTSILTYCKHTKGTGNIVFRMETLGWHNRKKPGVRQKR
jgi:hypothetical protein